MNEEFLTVSELNNFIRDVLNSGFPRALWICGEIQGYDRGKDKKHVFFDLCEKDPASHEIIARAGLVMFANARPRIEAMLKKAENAFALKDDIEVKFLCKVDFYPAHGQVRLIVESIDPIYTLGKIAQDRQRLIAALKQKGVLEQNKRLGLSRVPLNIGLITSYDSAAYHDFIDELKRSGYGFKIFVANTVMQGKNAESSVVKSLKFLDRMETLDVVVITRGGGSIADLACFDSQAMAEAIAQARLPVISGIGHEINTTVTDLAAHTFAKTPTAAARLLMGRTEEFLLHLREKNEELMRLAQEHVQGQHRRLRYAAGIAHTGILALLKSHQQETARIGEALKRAPLNLIKQSRQKTAQQREDLKKTIHLRLQNSRAKISQQQKLIEMADPKNILKRGFSITRTREGKSVRCVQDARTHKTLITVLMDGQVASEVIE
ncbi:MAG: exodeoxyribonuclease VII large subunit [Candidatus Omnitrophica bacterium]|nr:exodeoxyribonuclease VII large subunit [Candidatus Omnitrophota bacterium]